MIIVKKILSMVFIGSAVVFFVTSQGLQGSDNKKLKQETCISNQEFRSKLKRSLPCIKQMVLLLKENKRQEQKVVTNPTFLLRACSSCDNLSHEEQLLALGVVPPMVIIADHHPYPIELYERILGMSEDKGC